jgi:hypothetical protein
MGDDQDIRKQTERYGYVPDSNKPTLRERIEELYKDLGLTPEDHRVRNILSLIEEVCKEVIGDPDFECPCGLESCYTNNSNRIIKEQLSKLQEILK